MIGLIAIALSAAAPAGQAAVEGADPTTEGKPDIGKRLCRREVPTGGIMLGRRICLTAAEWKRVGDVRESRSEGFFNRAVRPVPKD